MNKSFTSGATDRRLEIVESIAKYIVRKKLKTQPSNNIAVPVFDHLFISAYEVTVWLLCKAKILKPFEAQGRFYELANEEVDTRKLIAINLDSLPIEDHCLHVLMMLQQQEHNFTDESEENLSASLVKFGLSDGIHWTQEGERIDQIQHRDFEA